jgi:hypothetical protein
MSTDIVCTAGCSLAHGALDLLTFWTPKLRKIWVHT